MYKWECINTDIYRYMNSIFNAKKIYNKYLANFSSFVIFPLLI